MRFSNFGGTALGLRILYGGMITHAAFLDSSIGMAMAGSATFHTGVGGLAVALKGLMAMLAAWIVFGIRTRVVALMALVAYMALVWLEFGSQISRNADQLMPVTIVILLAAPLILFGGGPYSLYRGGWRNPF